ncbi:MAG TPA: imidazole glycerol phosphate synthase subunit HisH [Thermoanaerobaculia bacterium]|nr:imidazole glycerol phosphate synthase subunit HisH [Thermoanaerobaculia bacterium]
MAVTLIDSPVANVANIARALRHAGAALNVTRDPETIASAAKLVLPGVGSFVAAMRWLVDSQVGAAIHRAVDRGAPLLGICVGHQLLFDVSHEMGTTAGLGLCRGVVRRFEGALPIPQIGWNRVAIAPNVLFDGIETGTPFYFVNSYAATGAESSAIAWADYDGPFPAAVNSRNVWGVQFHPEKSSNAGLRVLRNYVEKIM